MSIHTQTALPTSLPLQSPHTNQCLLLPGISWETYERLLADCSDSHAAHFSYDQGVLEIMVLSLRHEKLKHILETLVEFLAAELDIDIEGAGSTTFRRADLARGFEPDACFYIANADYIRQKEEVDLAEDPAPDLVIEIDISSPSLEKLPIYAAVGVPEIWRYTGTAVIIFQLQEGVYRESEHSFAFPHLTHTVLSQFVEDGQTSRRAAWLRKLRAWAQEVTE